VEGQLHADQELFKVGEPSIGGALRGEGEVVGFAAEGFGDVGDYGGEVEDAVENRLVRSEP
jgi:hypothetical protein